MGSIRNQPMQTLFNAMQRKIAILACFLLLGCSNTTVSENIAVGAKESISAIYNRLPKECQTKDVNEANINAQKQVDNVIQACKLERNNLEERLRYKNLLVVGLSVLVCILIFLLLRKSLSGISLPTLGSLLNRNNQNSENL